MTIPKLIKVFVLSESEKDPEYWGMDQSAKENLAKFLQKFSRESGYHPGVSLGEYLLFVDDFYGDQSLRTAIENDGDSEIQKVSRDLLSKYDPKKVGKENNLGNQITGNNLGSDKVVQDYSPQKSLKNSRER